MGTATFSKWHVRKDKAGGKLGALPNVQTR